MAKVWRRANVVFLFVPLVVFAALLAGHAGCSTKACGLAGCQDQFRAKITGADGSVPAGTQVVDVEADGVTTTCTFQAGGGTATPQCPLGLGVLIGQEQDCKEVDTATAKGLVCTPIAGRFYEDVTLTGKPAQVRVRITVDGAVVLDSTIAPSYTTAQPNGPECEPTCQQASATWTFVAK